MINWPTNLTPTARKNLDRFRSTSAAADLESDSKNWVVENWAWTTEPPLHVRLRDEDLTELDFTMGEDGMWRTERAPSDTHLSPPLDLVCGEKCVEEVQVKDLESAVPPGCETRDHACALPRRRGRAPATPRK